MRTNTQLITDFYTAFQNKNYGVMQTCYANSATFTDSVFCGLNAIQVCAMWEMLLKSSSDLRIEFKNIRVDEKTGSAEWTAYYTFSKTGNKVVNKIKADFEFSEGKIVKHTDVFDFYTWARQALGLPGILLGWTPFMKNKIRKTAMENLERFMAKSK